MKVRDVMKSQPRVCSPRHGLATAGRIMAEIDGGVLPVVGEDGSVVGMITDRDICSTVSIRDRRPSEIRVSEAMSEAVHDCRAEDEVEDALQTMRDHRVRRLPVLDAGGRLVGLFTLDDIALEVKAFATGAAGSPLHRDVAETLKAIATHSVLAPSR